MSTKAAVTRLLPSAILLSVTIFLLSGCGGGGGGSSTTVSTSSSDPTVTGTQTSQGTQQPALLVSSTLGTVLTYQGIQKTITQSSALAQTHSLSIATGLEPSYVLGSIKPFTSSNDDTTNSKLSSLAIDGLVYVNDSTQLAYIDGKTLKETAISPVLTQSSDHPSYPIRGAGSLCGFWSQTVKNNSARYFIYITGSPDCTSDPQSLTSHFYIASTNDTTSTQPREIDRPLAALSNGWLMMSPPSQLGTIELYTCDASCSTKSATVATLTEDEFYQYHFMRPFPLNTVAQLPHSNISTQPNYHLLSADVTLKKFKSSGSNTSDSDSIANWVYVFDENKSTNPLTRIAPASIPDPNNPTKFTLPSKSAVIAEDDQYIYLPHSESSTTTGGTNNTSELLRVSKTDLTQNAIDLKTALKDVISAGTNQNFSYTAISPTLNYIFMVLKTGTSNTQYMVTINKSEFTKSTPVGLSPINSTAYSNITDSDSNNSQSSQSSLDLFSGDWFNNVALYNFSYSSSAVSYSYYGSVSMASDGTVSVSKPSIQGKWLLALSDTETSANYFPKLKYLNASRNTDSNNITDSINLTAHTFSTDSSLPSKVQDTSVKIGQLAGSTFNVGLFLTYGSNDALLSKLTGTIKYYSFDANTQDSLTCFYNCSN